jgi:hypothetical protein
MGEARSFGDVLLELQHMTAFGTSLPFAAVQN